MRDERCVCHNVCVSEVCIIPVKGMCDFTQTHCISLSEGGVCFYCTEDVCVLIISDM